ncbi:hypothetical protein B0H19DRAFT_1242765 [Mycena capillaripes]|nr:hypothetical protein B0H19DRAFT_1242765 [Mycena capillaripes]
MSRPQAQRQNGRLAMLSGSLLCTLQPLDWIKAFNVKVETADKILNLNSSTPSDEPAPHDFSSSYGLPSPSGCAENILSKLYFARLGLNAFDLVCRSTLQMQGINHCDKGKNTDSTRRVEVRVSTTTSLMVPNSPELESSPVRQLCRPIMSVSVSETLPSGKAVGCSGPVNSRICIPRCIHTCGLCIFSL